MYLGPSENIVGGILVWNPITKVAIDRDSYRLVPYVPENWVLTPKSIPFQLPLADELVEEPTTELISNADIEDITKPPTQDENKAK
jgi:hypothetical protein